MAVTQESIAQVRITLDGFSDAYGRGDVDEIMSYFAPEESLVGFGTGADERNLGWAEHRAQIERDLAQSESRQVYITWFKGQVAGDLAWAATEWSYKVVAGGQELQGNARTTYVLKKYDGKWLIVQSHASLPAAQAEGESFPKA